MSWGNYNEGVELKDRLEAYKTRYGKYPSVVCAYKIYRNCNNLEFRKEHHIRLSGSKLGRSYKDEARRTELRRIEREDEGTRVAIEAKFGEAKRTYTLDTIMTKLKETSESAITLLFFVMNLMKKVRDRVRCFFVAFLESHPGLGSIDFFWLEGRDWLYG